jgi:hypothetical protein
MPQKIKSGQITPDYIQLTLAANQSFSTAADINTSNTEFSAGTKLTKSTNKVLIGDGVSKVRVSYSIMAESASTATYMYTRITRSGVQISQAIDAAASVGFRHTSESRIISVSSGNTVYVVADTGGGSATARYATLLVEVIE